MIKLMEADTYWLCGTKMWDCIFVCAYGSVEWLCMCDCVYVCACDYMCVCFWVGVQEPSVRVYVYVVYAVCCFDTDNVFVSMFVIVFTRQVEDIKVPSD